MTTAQHREILLEQLAVSSTTSQIERRKAFDKAKLAELAESIKVDGILQPLIVRGVPSQSNVPGHYEIIAGERRFLAAQLAGLERVPCTVREGVDAEGVIRIQLIENLQREDVHPMHEAEGYEELLHTHHRPIEEVCAEVGKSKAYVYGRMKLLALSKACRKAFYAGEISASIAEKLARLPVQSLQDEALEDVLGHPHAKQRWNRSEPLSYRQAVEHINGKFMLDLAHAPFPVADPQLNGKAGPCGACPKNTSNAPDLFGDVKAGTCTDTTCFAAKMHAFGQRQVDAAEVEGRETFTGARAKSLIQYGGNGDIDRIQLRNGWHLLSGEFYNGNGYKKVKSCLKPDAKVAVLLEPTSGRALEVVNESQLERAKERDMSHTSGDRAHRKAVAVAQRETKVRVAIFAAVREKLKPLSKRQIAELVALAFDREGWEQIRRLECAQKGVKFTVYKEPDYRDTTEELERRKTDAEVDRFMAEAWLAAELKASSYSTEKPVRLEAAAKAARVDVKKIRAELAPKSKKAKPKPNKKTKVKPLHKRKGMAALLKRQGGAS